MKCILWIFHLERDNNKSNLNNVLSQKPVSPILGCRVVLRRSHTEVEQFYFWMIMSNKTDYDDGEEIVSHLPSHVSSYMWILTCNKIILNMYKTQRFITKLIYHISSTGLCLCHCTTIIFTSVWFECTTNILMTIDNSN